MSTTSAVSSATTLASAATTSSAAVMGKDEFLKLLVTQLQHQDPLSPMEDKDYIAQLAQFSSLEQMTNMSRSLDTVGKSSAFSQALSMTGKWIEYSGASGQKMVGQVASVVYSDGKAKLMVDGSEVDVSSVSQIYPGSDALGQEKSATKAIGLIGEQVSYYDASTGVIKSGKVSGVDLSSGWPALTVGEDKFSIDAILDTNVASASDSDLYALAKSMVGMKVDYKSGDQTLSGQVLNASQEGEAIELKIGDTLISVSDVVKVYSAR